MSTIPGWMLNAAERLAQAQNCQVGIAPAGEVFRLVGRHDDWRCQLAAIVYPAGEVEYLSVGPDGQTLINGEEPNIAWARRYAPELIPAGFPNPKETRS